MPSNAPSQRIGLITVEDYEGLEVMVASITQALASHSIAVETVALEDIESQLGVFDAFLWQTASGYHKVIDRMLAVVEAIEKHGTPQFNSAETLRWNSDKRYLAELESKGHSILPTFWVEKDQPVSLKRIMVKYGWDDVVIKPRISAGAYLTKRVQPHQAEVADEWLKKHVAERPMIVQPFAPEILEEGEWSFLFFGGELSHTVVKNAKSGDYRIQHVHGGRFETQQAHQEVQKQAEAVLADLPEACPYARVDGIIRDGKLILMEVELIEPYLYLPVKDDAVADYATAIASALKPEPAKACA